MANSTPNVQIANDEMKFVNVCSAVLYSLNLPVFAIQIPLSLLNIGILSRTSLLHRNLKFVLLVQSSLFTLFALARSSQIIIIFSTNVDYQIGYKIVLFLTNFPSICITFIGHILFIERIIATIFFKNYEHAKSFTFSCIWFILLIFFSAAIAAQQSFRDQPQVDITNGVLISCCASLGICFSEIIAFSSINTLNLKLFTSKLASYNYSHNLSGRYQLAENIRTGRQLAPTFLLHFINICAIAVPSVLSFYKLVSNINLLWITYFLLLSICNILIEYTLISRHPIFRRNALRILSKCFRAFSLQVPCVQRVGDNSEAQNIGRIDGQRIEENKLSEMGTYFKILEEHW